LTISIEQKVRHCKVEERLKTTSALRKVDLHPEVAAMLKKFAGERKAGFLFRTRNGKPLGSSCILRRHLHPALKQLVSYMPKPRTSSIHEANITAVTCNSGRMVAYPSVAYPSVTPRQTPQGTARPVDNFRLLFSYTGLHGKP
jgi:hypothetical protein